MTALEALLSGAMPGPIAVEMDDELKIPTEVAIEILKEFKREYGLFLNGPCKFIPGDIVMPMKGMGNRYAGRPHIVLETLKPDAPYFCEDPASSGYGRRADIRVMAHVHGGDKVAMFWVESFEFEKYVPKSE